MLSGFPVLFFHVFLERSRFLSSRQRSIIFSCLVILLYLFLFYFLIYWKDGDLKCHTAIRNEIFDDYVSPLTL